MYLLFSDALLPLLLGNAHSHRLEKFEILKKGFLKQINDNFATEYFYEDFSSFVNYLQFKPFHNYKSRLIGREEH